MRHFGTCQWEDFSPDHDGRGATFGCIRPATMQGTFDTGDGHISLALCDQHLYRVVAECTWVK